MLYEFTKIDDEVLDFMVAHFNDLRQQVLTDRGKSVYWYHDLKVEISIGERE